MILKKDIKFQVFLKLTALTLVNLLLLANTAIAGSLSCFEPSYLSPDLQVGKLQLQQAIRMLYLDKQRELELEQKTNIPKPAEIVKNIFDKRYQKSQQMILIAEIKNKFAGTYPKEKQILLEKIIESAKQSYANTQFKTGEFYFNHVLLSAYEVQELGGSFEEICGMLFHRLNTEQIENIKHELVQGKIKKELGILRFIKTKKDAVIENSVEEEFKKLFEDIAKNLINNFMPMTNLRYELHSKGAYNLQNFIDGIIEKIPALEPDVITEKEGLLNCDYRVIRMVFADKLASIAAASEREQTQLTREILDVWGPLAYRFGIINLKNRLFNEAFRIGRKEDHQKILAKVERTYGREYEKLRVHLEHAKREFEQFIGKTKIKAEVSSRLKTEEKLDDKEETLTHEKGESDLLHSKDLLGIRVLCDANDFKSLERAFGSAIADGQFGRWKELTRAHKFDKKTGKEVDWVHYNLERYDGLTLEVQFLSYQYHRHLESEWPHWSYSLYRMSKEKQRFDDVELFRPRGDFELDVRRVYTRIKNKGYITVLYKADEDKEELAPKRMKQGAIGPDLAALRGVNKLDKDYAGIQHYEYDADGQLKEKNINPKSLKPLQPLDIVEVLSAPNGLIEDSRHLTEINSNAKLLRTAVMIQSIDSDEIEKNIKSGRKKMNTLLEQYGIIFNDLSTEQRKRLGTFLYKYAYGKKRLKVPKRKGVRSFEELYIALVGTPIWMVVKEEIINEAYDLGLELLIKHDPANYYLQILDSLSEKKQKELLVKIGMQVITVAEAQGIIITSATADEQVHEFALKIKNPLIQIKGFTLEDVKKGILGILKDMDIENNLEKIEPRKRGKKAGEIVFNIVVHSGKIIQELETKIQKLAEALNNEKKPYKDAPDISIKILKRDITPTKKQVLIIEAPKSQKAEKLLSLVAKKLTVMESCETQECGFYDITAQGNTQVKCIVEIPAHITEEQIQKLFTKKYAVKFLSVDPGVHGEAMDQKFILKIPEKELKQKIINEIKKIGILQFTDTEKGIRMALFTRFTQDQIKAKIREFSPNLTIRFLESDSGYLPSLVKQEVTKSSQEMISQSI